MNKFGTFLMIGAILLVMVVILPILNMGQSSGWEGEGGMGAALFLLIFGLPAVLIGIAIFLGGAAFSTSGRGKKGQAAPLTLADGTVLEPNRQSDGSISYDARNTASEKSRAKSLFANLGLGFYLLAAVVFGYFLIYALTEMRDSDIVGVLFVILGAVPALCCVIAGNLFRRISRQV